MYTAESTQLLLEILDRSFDQTSWHGPNLRNSLRGVSAKLAARRIGGCKSIWQQALHAAYWKQRVLNKLIGTQPFPRTGSNWLKLPDEISERQWRLDLKMLEEIHAKLRKAVAALDPRQLSNTRLRMMIFGVAMHDVYHAGQIKLLRKMLA